VIILDSDTVSALFRAPNDHATLSDRIRATPPDEIGITAISVAEILEGFLALIRKQQARNQESAAYELLVQAFRYLNRFPILPYDAESERMFLAFPPRVRRIGRGDCQIAAIALRHGGTIVTRNLRHFQAVPGILCDDWTLP
jgi:predicted nucleic acid-binding protein